MPVRRRNDKANRISAHRDCEFNCFVASSPCFAALSSSNPDAVFGFACMEFSLSLMWLVRNLQNQSHSCRSSSLKLWALRLCLSIILAICVYALFIAPFPRYILVLVQIPKDGFLYQISIILILASPLLFPSTLSQSAHPLQSPLVLSQQSACQQACSTA